MRRLVRIIARAGHDSDIWPVILLLFAVLVPAVCLLWFMGAAMRNERFAARQKLTDLYHDQLLSSQARLEQRWDEVIGELEKLGRTTPASAAFAKCVQSGFVDSALILDEQGTILYPATPSAGLTGSGEGRERGQGDGELESKWAAASRLEYSRKDLMAAASRYEGLAQASTNVDTAARALQAQARCLVQAGQKDAAIWLINDVLGAERYDRAVDGQGRLIAANAELMALELLTHRTSSAFRTTAGRLQQRLLDYDNPALAGSQRLFLMKELQSLSPQMAFPTLVAEELAANLAFTSPPHAAPAREKKLPEGRLRRTAHPALWEFATPNRRVLALVRPERLSARLQPAIASERPGADEKIALLPPDADSAAAWTTLPAGERLPGWRLALSLKDSTLLEAATEHRTAIYLWTGVLVVAGMSVLALLAMRLLRRRVALARLRNDLAATVSHELRTPLASMRVLVDTLLNADRIEETKAREYLELIARENDRLSRLIQNFLTFSRLERDRHTFEFTSVRPTQVVDAAVNAIRERLDAPGCRFEVQVEGHPPNVIADADALTTVLINLLDNACKYSEDIKHIILAVRATNGCVAFSVRDHGIGIAPPDTRRIFQPFHQADQRLSRKGSGCGLGLSIVQSIVKAHQGRVSVESRPGGGSTFTVSLPVAPDARKARKAAIA